ncbi:hypothetical protein SGGMMB4_01717 [Sodalis glossinidius str. 'morsitans']|uniref:Uncharacterized protein n=1 Tax=Sodalis glossinidius (strain morsitans) TaxID=343509 RepID=A0A193QI13_SODGM|nr:transcriptional regulator [Sodalis glossinidius]CRL44560.1 hypothetical protein SGGMMB4_01717 [Sodalis glossinidius str. 'morsitans']
MKVFDPAQYPELRNLFPELTPVQFETAFLFSFGCSQKEISVLRAVNYRLVQREIAGYHFTNNNTILTIH